MSELRKTKNLPAIQLLLKHLEAEGVEYIFGIPGGPLMPLYEALAERGTIRPILTKHEEGAAFMADGYARLRRGLGVCCVTTGPGATNAVTGIATSYADGVPVLLLTAQVATSAFGRGAIQESSPQGINVVDLFKPITKASLMLMRADKMGEMTRHLLRAATSGRPGPVHFNIPADLAKQPIPDEKVPKTYRVTNHTFDREAVKKAADYLVHAKRPAILAGSGIVFSGGHQELKKLSERLMIPVATTVKAKGAFPEDHILSLGVFGFAGSPRAEAYLLSGEVDVLLTVGTSLGEDATNGWDPHLQPREALLQVDIDSTAMGNNYQVTVSLLGDAKTILEEILHHAHRELQWKEERKVRTLNHLAELRAQHPWAVDEEKMNSDAIPLKPQRLIKDLEEVLPTNAVIFTDIGYHMVWAFHYLKMNRPDSLFHCLGFSAMGYGTAACIGAKLAAPERPVIAIVGDGAFAMNGLEVHTAVEYDIPVIWIVFNNGGHGMIYHGERVQFGGRFHNSLFQTPIDFCKLGESLGLTTHRVTRPGQLQKVMEKALKDGHPTIIDAHVDLHESPPIGSRFKTLNRFFEGVDGRAQ